MRLGGTCGRACLPVGESVVRYIMSFTGDLLPVRRTFRTGGQGSGYEAGGISVDGAARISPRAEISPPTAESEPPERLTAHSPSDGCGQSMRHA